MRAPLRRRGGPGPGPRPARMAFGDRLRTGAGGLRARPTRVVLSALGIAIGIAAMVAVVGVSSSGRAELDERIGRLGTNLVTVSPGSDLFGGEATLPEEAQGRIGRMPEVESVSQVELLSGTNVYRSDLVPSGESGGIGAYAVDPGLLETIRAEVRLGSGLNPATRDHPSVVLGAAAAERLGIDRITPDTVVLIGDTYFSVVGVLERADLAPELDNAALIGRSVAERVFGAEGEASTVYVRVDPEKVASVRERVGRNANPERPNEVEVSRPSDALEARRAADQTLNGLLLGLGGVALLVGGVGVANTMVISVLERRGEIGLRRALGATRRDVRTQFLVEAMALSALGGLAGVLLGAAATAGYALLRGWPVALPWWAGVGAVCVTVLIGAVAGLWPALRAAAQQPTEALGSA
ncbi:ABC transporter permease [Nocardiopsis sp. MG754419]|uniref:ABC transporter permease n=1 Tax=Nocardiopsis sp. MG754419 TaxID=2259865 RepID=UPI001BACC02E|nr:ABC transporter permease [Nocardiopsis sp. MG754419]MBR8741106.1 ABC transporter permease [Nocardiopsis sp. MG754419]